MDAKKCKQGIGLSGAIYAYTFGKESNHNLNKVKGTFSKTVIDFNPAILVTFSSWNFDHNSHSVNTCQVTFSPLLKCFVNIV